MALGACGHDRDQAVHGSEVPGAKPHTCCSAAAARARSASPRRRRRQRCPHVRARTRPGASSITRAPVITVRSLCTATMHRCARPTRSWARRPARSPGGPRRKAGGLRLFAPTAVPSKSGRRACQLGGARACQLGGAACLSVGRGGVLVSWAARTPHQPCALVQRRREVGLHLGLLGRGVGGKDLQDEREAVDHRAAPARPNGCLMQAPWLMNGGHGASLRQPFGSASAAMSGCPSQRRVDHTDTGAHEYRRSKT
eukprot:COSAG01_NODE_5486_length_4230_cov_2.267974_6_plen_255_part_00